MDGSQEKRGGGGEMVRKFERSGQPNRRRKKRGIRIGSTAIYCVPYMQYYYCLRVCQCGNGSIWFGALKPPLQVGSNYKMGFRLSSAYRCQVHSLGL